MAEPTPEEYAEIKKVFDQIALIVAGNRCLFAGAAVQDMLCALIAHNSETLDEALGYVDAVGDDMRKTVRKNWDFYKSAKGTLGIGMPGGNA